MTAPASPPVAVGVDLRQAFAEFVDAIKRAPISWETGTCCCGNAVDSHGFGDGHSPVDEGSYFIMNAIKDAEEALASPVSGDGSSADADTHRTTVNSSSSNEGGSL